MINEMKSIRSFLKVASHRLNYENYGGNQGLLWQFCYDVAGDFYEPLDGWKVIGWTPNPPWKGPRKNSSAFVMEHEDGRIAWWHFNDDFKIGQRCIKSPRERERIK